MTEGTVDALFKFMGLNPGPAGAKSSPQGKKLK